MKGIDKLTLAEAVEEASYVNSSMIWIDPHKNESLGYDDLMEKAKTDKRFYTVSRQGDIIGLLFVMFRNELTAIEGDIEYEAFVLPGF